MLFNNPLNPTATIFRTPTSPSSPISARRFDAVAICDEVWEHVVFDGRRHKPLIGLSGMRERTIKIGSAGKIFNLTGWKVGFVCAAPTLLKVLAKAHQFLTFTTPPNLQAAVAYGLGKDDAYFETLRADLARSRDRFTAGLETLGFSVIPSRGTYFLNIDIAPLGEPDDAAFCRRLVAEYGVAAIPVSALLCGRGGAERRALLLREEGRDAGRGAGEAGGGGGEGLTARRADTAAERWGRELPSFRPQTRSRRSDSRRSRQIAQSSFSARPRTTRTTASSTTRRAAECSTIPTARARMWR